MITFEQLRWGNICGIIDSYGAVDSQFTEKMEFHEEFWNPKPQICWRWNWNESIYWIPGSHRLNDEEYDSIIRHIEKKYGIKFWDNGHHDIDYFLKRLKKDRKKGKNL